MDFREPIIRNAVQTDNLCRILPDDEIRLSVEREISSMKYPLKSMVLTWEKSQTEYCLVIILTEEIIEGTAAPETKHITVGYIDEKEYGALNTLVMAGRRLYFRLRNDFPILQRRLSTYRFHSAKRCLQH